MGCPVGEAEVPPARASRLVLRLRYGLLLRLEVGVGVALVGVAAELLAAALLLFEEVAEVFTVGGFVAEELFPLVCLEVARPPLLASDNKLGSKFASTFELGPAFAA